MSAQFDPSGEAPAPPAMSPAQFALLARAAPDGVVAGDAAEAADLCTLGRLGLLARHAAGIYVLTDAGRRYLEIEGPRRASGG